MVYTYLLFVVLVAYAQATYSSDELLARAAIQADATSSLNAEDVITAKDFSEDEYNALQQLSEGEFWNELDSQLSEYEHSFIEADKAKAAAAKKVADAKAAADKKVADAKAAAAKKPAAAKAAAGKKPAAAKAANTLPSGITAKDIAVAEAMGETPFDKKVKALDAKPFANEDPEEFVTTHHVIPLPTKSDETITLNAKRMKQLKKSLIKDGKGIHAEVFRLHRRITKFIGEEDWNKVKETRIKLRFYAKKFKNWKLRKDSYDALKQASSTIVDWETAYLASKIAVQKDYIKKQDTRAKSIRKAVEEHSKKVELAQILEIKARGLKALRKDLGALKGKAMNNFVKRYKAALYKTFGNKVVDAAVKKGGLKELRKVTGKKAGKILLEVAAHLPTVGPYIRAGLINESVAASAYAFVPKWRN